jgi:hypothetical protein
VRAVVTVGFADVPEIRGIADEVVATVLEAKQAQVERRVSVDVATGGGIPGDPWYDTAVDGVRTLEAVSSTRSRTAGPSA